MNKAAILNKNNYIYPSYHHYGCMAGFQDYGNNGVKLKNNLINLWRKHFVNEHNIYEMETPTIMPHNILKASGHVDKFTDYVVVDKNGITFRADHLVKEFFAKTNNKTNIDALLPQDLEKIINDNKLVEMAENEDYVHITTKNLMFNMSGPTSVDTFFSDANGNITYLRPELAQGIIVNLNKYLQSTNYLMPIGLAQVGKSYRNEISTKQFTRLREFTQAELEYFVDPEKKSDPSILKGLNLSNLIPVFNNNDDGFTNKSLQELLDAKLVKSYTMLSFISKIHKFALVIGLKNIRFRKHEDNEMAHYAIECWDLESKIDDNWLEVIGCADRGIWDCSVHSEVEKIVCKRVLDKPKIVIEKTIVLNKKEIAKNYSKHMKLISNYFDTEKTDSIINDIHTFGYVSVPGEDGYDLVITDNMITIMESRKNVTHEEFIPGIIEPSFGIDRLIYSILMQNMWSRKDESKGVRSVLSLPTYLSPYDLAIFTLLDREDLYSILNEIKNTVLENSQLNIYYDYSTTKIGKKYVRSDELGIKFVVTIDVQTLDDKCVTVRERDTMNQIRVLIPDLLVHVRTLMNN